MKIMHKELAQERAKSKVRINYNSMVVSQSSDGVSQDPDDIALLKTISYQEDDVKNRDLESISENNDENFDEMNMSKSDNNLAGIENELRSNSDDDLVDY